MSSADRGSSRFIGIDLAWQSDRNHTGIAVLEGGLCGGSLLAIAKNVRSITSVVDFVAEHAAEDTVVAIDAPLIIRNAAGQRPCEKKIGQLFWRFHASAHTSNLARFPDAGSVRLVTMLAQLGFRHDPDPSRDARRRGRWIFEVYPHPAMVILFGLDRILKYKRGPISERRSGLGFLRERLHSLSDGAPPMSPNALLASLLDHNLDGVRGVELKGYEDTLDAIFCAYLAMHYWFWGGVRNQMIGDTETGYIITPTPP